ncbi:1,6-anhydro-N-acetylmuramyl-L-alanine amidase AmpD [Luminiphilus sp.]|nr:1,6-anhydro-N-acetylmuramyl-L-alanine amidase AmpD [Luminiphilus sp.]MDB2440070.1 1,6-anhydro-N-acetylmuramyl-L-alanine amidase AmpD [Luminiphilus sp.]MDB2557359.1 1,6-anhydro-N-acetylmuramyl-L-alanine amidase AmpD [Luminiphilus sp.]MDB3899792.1 1,6-anhydro-N-acetylmuramyl-L-alanine amidase AmpD [Luminiphilus sp.]
MKHRLSGDFHVIDNKYGQIVSGWLQGCTQVPSANCGERPEGASVDLIVLHNISLPPDEFGGPYIEQLFTNTLNPQEHPYFETIADLEVSAHFLIKRTGEVIQFVPTQKAAWHAGVSLWRGRERCNDFSIGIELEGTDTHLYTHEQYERLEEIIVKCRDAHPEIPRDAIVGHSDIAPGRKTDPGDSFDWQRIQKILGLDALLRS